MEAKPDGFRAILFACPGLVMVQCRQGGDLTGALSDVATAAAELGEALVLDGEPVVPHGGRLHFGELHVLLDLAEDCPTIVVSYEPVP
ncbi:hypothetical protein [Streptomyces sp. S3(2020)]|uniref:hypothetical protein n=1 Tax=Streptomyces sp. S3(2020) TaxID=2732044 RepID=UPI0019CFCABC|nr:hypothetical protein [Streptomyces sp. S3(2020)]